MSTLKLPKELDFDRITRAIMGKEALGMIFRESEIRDDAPDGERYNRATFRLHPEGIDPPLCVVQATADAIPAGHAEEWVGQMLVEGRVRNVRLCRASARD